MPHVVINIWSRNDYKKLQQEHISINLNYWVYFEKNKDFEMESKYDLSNFVSFLTWIMFYSLTFTNVNI